jgi:hypothetical protein
LNTFFERYIKYWACVYPYRRSLHRYHVGLTGKR